MKTIALCVALLVAGASFGHASSDVPDLKGRWVVDIRVAGHKPAGDLEPSERRFVEEFQIDVMIEWQDGHLFGGAELVQGGGEKHEIIRDEFYSGAISPDGTRVHMVDDNGFDNCTVISPDRLECVYRHIDPRHSVVGNSVWTKVE